MEDFELKEHIVPATTYVIIFVALLALTLITSLVALLDLGRFNGPLAVVIAGIKTLLVAAVFMHLRYSGRLTLTIAVAGIFWLMIFITLTVSDYVSRFWPT